MKYLLPLVGILAVLGAGCGGSGTPTQDPSNAVSGSVRSIEAGDTLIVAEGASVVKGVFEDKPVERRITPTMFEMGKAFTGNWRLVDANDIARELDRGSFTGVTLNTAHPFYFPSMIDAKGRPIGDSSMLALAREEYRELVNTAGTTMDPRFLEEGAWADRLNAHPPAARAFGALQALAREALAANTDLVFARKQPEKATMQVRVNGQEQELTVIRVKNWYGTFDVWDQERSPIVLAFTLNPQVDAKRLDVTQGDGAELAKLVNYRVRAIEYRP